MVLAAGEQSHGEEHGESVERSSFFSTSSKRFGSVDPESYRRESATASTQTWSVGTTVSGDTVTIGAGHDLHGTAAQIAGTHDVTLAAGHDLVLDAGQDTSTESEGTKVSRTGLMNGGGLSVLIGNRTTQADTTVRDVSYTGSLVGSTDGQVTLSAGHDVHLTGSDVLSQTGTTIVGQDVTIDAALGSTDVTQQQRVHTGGINVGLSGGMASVAQDVYDTGQAHTQGHQDSRVLALHDMQAASHIALHADEIASGIQNVSNGGTGGINLQVGIGGSTASSQTKTHDETTYGSLVQSNGDVMIAATGGDLSITGSDVSGSNVTMVARHDINILSQAENHTLKSDNKNASVGIGLQIGTDGIGLYAQASEGTARTHGNGTAHTESQIDATGTLELIAGNDALLQGTQLRGNSVVADIANNLTLRSEQDTDDYASKQWQAGGKVVIGYSSGGSVSYSQSKTHTHYQSVVEQTGVTAGNGGYLVSVGNHTQLDGAVISSSADADLNVLSTSSLGYTNIHNEAEYSGSSSGASLSYSAGSVGPSKLGGTAVPTLGDRGGRTNETRSAIAEGLLVVGDGSGLDISRNTSNTNGSIKAYDARSIEKDQNFASALVGTSLSIADDYYTMRQGQFDQQIEAAKENAKASEAAGDTRASQVYWREVADLREERDNPNVNMAEVRGVIGLLASAAAGSPSLSYALESSSIGYVGNAWAKAGVGHNETMALKVICTKNAAECVNGIELPKGASVDERIQYAKDHGLNIEYVNEIPSGAQVIATNGILNDEARAAQLAIGHAAGDDGNQNGGDSPGMTIYLQFNDTKGALSDLMQAGYDKFVAPALSDYSATTYAFADAAAKQGSNRVEMDGHSWGSITTRNALYVLADKGYQNNQMVVKVFGPAVSPGDMVKATQSVTGGNVGNGKSLYYYSSPSDPVAGFVGGTLLYSSYLDASKPDQHIPGAAQAYAIGALIGFGSVYGGVINPHSCYALNCRGVSGGDEYSWTVQKAEEHGKSKKGP